MRRSGSGGAEDGTRVGTHESSSADTVLARPPLVHPRQGPGCPASRHIQLPHRQRLRCNYIHAATKVQIMPDRPSLQANSLDCWITPRSVGSRCGGLPAERYLQRRCILDYYALCPILCCHRGVGDVTHFCASSSRAVNTLHSTTLANSTDFTKAGP